MFRVPVLVLFVTVAALHTARSDIVPDSTIGADSVISPAQRQTTDSTHAVELDRMKVTAKVGAVFHPTVTAVKSDEFSATYRDVPAILDGIPGILIRRAGASGEFSEASIRGGSALETGVYLDGIPLNTASGGSVDLGQIPLGLVKEVDVFKGTSPLGFSSRQSGGAINLVTDPRHDIASATVEAGSFGQVRLGSMLRRSTEKWTHNLLIGHEEAKNDYPFLYDNGTVFNKGDDAVLAKGNNEYSSSSAVFSTTFLPDTWRRLGATVAWYSNEGGVFNPTYAKVDQQTRHSSQTGAFSVRYDGMLNEWIRQSLQIDTRLQESRFSDPLNQFFLGVNKKFRDFQPMGEGIWTGEIQPGNGWVFRGTIDGMYEHWRHFVLLTNDSIMGFSRRIQTGAGVEASFEPVRNNYLRIRGLCHVQWDTTALPAGFGYLDGMYTTAFDVVPAVEFEGGTDLTKEISLFISGKNVRRTPTFSERFGKGRGFWGNPELRPEEKIEYDGGARLAIDRVDVTGTWFQGWAWDRIGSLYRSGAFVPSNFGRVDYLGLELAVGWKPFAWLCVHNSLTVLRSVFGRHEIDEYVGNQVPYSPWLKDQLDINAAFGPVAAVHRIQYTAPYFVAAPNSRNDLMAQMPVCDAGLTISYRDMLALSYRIDNYLDVINSDYRDLPRPGRSHHVVFTITKL